MKNLRFAICAAALSAAIFAGPAYAQQAVEETILVSPQAVETAFAQTVARRLDRQLRHMTMPRGLREGGIVQVSFVVSDSGEAEYARILESSANADIDNAAVSAVSRIRRLGSSPGADWQEVHATIIFALTEREERLLTERALRQHEAQVAAGESAGSSVLALIVVPDTRS